jgi:hypothetical protein
MLEMLDCVGDESFVTRDACITECLIENTAGGSNERLAGEIFLIARLLADQHERSMARSFTGNRLRGVAVQRAACATALGLGQMSKRLDRRSPFYLQFF